MSQSNAIAGTFNQTGNVCHDERLFFRYTYHAQYRGNGCEMVIGNFRFSSADYRNQRGFSNIWISYKSDISQQLEFQGDFKFFSREARLCKTWNLTGRGGKVNVSLSAATAFCQNLWFIGREVCHNPARCSVADHGSTGNPNDQIRCASSGTIPSTAIFPSLCHIFSLIAEVNQRGEVIVYLKDDVAAFSAVSAVRSTGCHIFFSMKGDCAVSAVSGFDFDFRLIYKHDFILY